MSAPIRFLGMVVIGWAGVRAMTLGAVPGFTVSYAKEVPPSGLPPIVRTEFPPIDALEPPVSQQWQQAQYPQPYPPFPAMPAGATNTSPYYPSYAVRPESLPPIPPRPQWQLPSHSSSGRAFRSPLHPLGDWQLAGLSALPGGRSSPARSAQSPSIAGRQPRLDRVQLTSWALLRGSPAPGALATGGTLGGSQAGARLQYNFSHWLAASLRTTSPVGGSRGAEVAGGVTIKPLRSIPVAITAERRQSVSPHGGGRSAFAVFAEGGLYHQPMPFNFRLDAYAQGGVVGLNSRDLFADGALAFTRPVWGRVSAGFGLWGGAQPGLYRVDAGPRLSFRIRDNIYAHVDWRQRLAGTARPSSGPALTLAGDF